MIGRNGMHTYRLLVETPWFDADNQKYQVVLLVCDRRICGYTFEYENIARDLQIHPNKLKSLCTWSKGKISKNGHILFNSLDNAHNFIDKLDPYMIMLSLAQ